MNRMRTHLFLAAFSAAFALNQPAPGVETAPSPGGPQRLIQEINATLESSTAERDQ